MIIEDFLAKLGASTKITVGVSVSPVVGLEMIEVDRLTGTVSKYASKPLEYNHSNREIANYDRFKTALSELFEELHIPKRSNIILSIPNVLFGIINLPLLLTDEAITNSILSEAEQSYIFKRQDPIISWDEISSNVDTENRTLAFSAIQDRALNEIKLCCEEVGCTLVGVENSYTSLLKTLHYTKLAEDQMKEGVTWNLMIISPNSYSILSILDKRIIEYYEEPLALKSFVDNEIYNAITTSAQLTLAGLPANYLFIASETDLVSAEVLSMKMNIEYPIKFLECNKYAQNELLPANLNILSKKALQISPEAVGAAIYPFSSFPLKLNLIKNKDGDLASGDTTSYPKINIGNLEIELTPDFVKRIAIMFGIIVVIPLFIISLLLSKVFIPKQQAKLDALNLKISQTQAMIDKYAGSKDNTFNLKTATDNILNQNKIKLNYYGALGLSIPNKLWITYYTSNEAGKLDIKGKSSDVESIYTFYKNLKQLVNNSDIRLYKLEVSSDSIDDIVENVSKANKYYEFEMTNMTEAELNPATQTAAGKNPPEQPGTSGKTNPAGQPSAAAATSPTGQTNSGGPNMDKLSKSLFGGSNQSSQPQSKTTAPGSTSAATPPTHSGSPDKLPSNLQKIEKF